MAKGTRDGGKSIQRGVGWQQYCSRIEVPVSLCHSVTFLRYCTFKASFFLVVTFHFPTLLLSEFPWLLFLPGDFKFGTKVGQKIKCSENLLNLIGRTTWHMLVFHFVHAACIYPVHCICIPSDAARTEASVGQLPGVNETLRDGLARRGRW